MNKQIGKVYKRYADKINEWARAKQLEDGMSYTDMWNALEEDLQGHKDIPCKQIAWILSQIERYGHTVPDLELNDRWKTRKENENDRMRQPPMSEYNGMKYEYSEGLQVLSCRPDPENERQIIYMLR